MTEPSSNTSDVAPNGETSEGDEEGGYVETRGPPIPEAAYSVINPLTRLMLRSPLHSLVSDLLLSLTFTGAKTGEEYTTPVGYWVRDNRVIVTTQSPWWRNLKGGAPVTLRLRGEQREGIATPHPDPEVVAQYVREFIDRHGTDAARRLALRIDGDRTPTLDELEDGVTGLDVVEIQLEDGEPP